MEILLIAHQDLEGTAAVWINPTHNQAGGTTPSKEVTTAASRSVSNSTFFWASQASCGCLVLHS